MLLSGLSLLLLFASSVGSTHVHKALDCLHPLAEDVEACSQPVDHVVAVVPGISYAAKIECNDCPYAQRTDQVASAGHDILKSNHILFLNLTLSHDKRTILLNDNPIYPLQTIPTPPTFYVTQFPSSFSNTNLSAGIKCSNPYCLNTVDDCLDWCSNLPLSSIGIDYVYTTRSTEYDGHDKDADAQYWDVTLDVIGGVSGYESDPRWKFDGASQKMLWMLVAGREAKYKDEKDIKATSDLFGPFGEDQKTYEYHIVDMRLQERAYTFPNRQPLTLWGRIRRFFGNDIWEGEGRFIYLAGEWGWYGKKGTLRNMFGDFTHWDFWHWVWIILGSTIAGTLVLSGLYQLYFWIAQQRELAKWDGMDDVWDRLRREPTAEEEDALLNAAYRDEPDEGGSSRPPRYTDEPRTMKPLPSKPLPEKPLPAVPLIDA